MASVVGWVGAYEDGNAGLTLDVGNLDTEAAIADDDLAIIYHRGDDDAATFGLTGTGWEEVDQLGETGGTDSTEAVYRKVISASEPNPVVTTDIADHHGAVMFVLRGTDPATPVDVTYVRANHYGENSNAQEGPNPPITTNSDNAIIVLLHGLTTSSDAFANGNGGGAPSGYSHEVAYGNPRSSIEIAVLLDGGTAGTKTPGVWTTTGDGFGGGSEERMFTLAFKAATGGGPVTGTAAVDYGGNVAATGTPAHLGAASAAYGGTVTAAGQATKAGTATGSYGGAVTATGTIPTSTVTGTVALNYGGTISAAAQITHMGTATGSYGYQVTATGSVSGQFPATIQATGETDLWTGASGDVADDPWIWRNPASPASSFILGACKSGGSDGGIYVFDLDGTEVDSWLLGTQINGVDGRDLSLYPTVDADWDDRVLVVVTDRDSNLLRYGFLGTDGSITTAGSTSVPFEPYGVTCYISPDDGKVYAFVSEATGGSGGLRQFELTISVDTVSGSAARTIDNGSLSEGMACDDAAGLFFLAEEDNGLYVYDAEPGGGAARTTIDTTSGNLTADVEGVTVIEPFGSLPGYIIVSSQGASNFQIYELESPHGYLATFEIVAGTFESVDACDGLHGHRDNFGSAHPNGILVTHDATNPTASNFKISDLGDLLGPIPIAGTATTDYGGAVTPTGTVIVTGTAALTYGGSVTANASPVTVGTAAAGYGGTTAAAGTRRTLGTAALGYAGSATVDGTPTRLGTAAAGYGGTVTAAGVIPTGAVLGTATLDYGGTVAASGQTTRSGTAAVGYGGQVVVDADAVRLGTAVLDYGTTLTAVGVTPTDSVTGIAVLTYGGQTTATGRASRHGTAVAGYGYTTNTNGLATLLATVVLDYGGTVIVLEDTGATVYLDDGGGAEVANVYCDFGAGAIPAKVTVI